MVTRRSKVLLITDSHSAHTSKKIADHVADYVERLQLEFLPGCANPAEYA